jgi:cytosine/creatinine deaminase
MSFCSGKKIDMSGNDLIFYQEALAEAKKGLAQKGIPIGAVLVHQGKIIGRGHNQRIQKDSAIRHGETDCLENAGRQKAEVYANATLYTTLSPCAMCSGTILLYKIPRVVIGENHNFFGEEDLLRSRGVELIVLNDAETISMMKNFIETHPSLWNEDIGVTELDTCHP